MTAQERARELLRQWVAAHRAFDIEEACRMARVAAGSREETLAEKAYRDTFDKGFRAGMELMRELVLHDVEKMLRLEREDG